MAESMVRGSKKRSPEEDIENLEDLLLEEDDGEKGKKKTNAGAAGKNKSESRNSLEKPGGNSGYKIPLMSNSKSKKGTNSKTTKGDNSQIVTNDNAAENVSNHDAVMAALMEIKSNQAKQSNDIKELSDRVKDIENYEYEEEYDANEGAQEEIEENPDEEQDISEPPTKKQKANEENNNSRFSSLAKRCKVTEVCGSKIDESLASTVTNLFRNGMNEDQYVDLVKDENTPRPENCEGLTIVRTNPLIWNVLPPWVQSSDKKMQNIEKTVLKAAIILTKTINSMSENDMTNDTDTVQNDKPKTNIALDKCFDALALLGHANKQINMARRDFIRTEVIQEYAHLCSHNEPYTSFLFGDDVSKAAKEIEDCSRVGLRIRGRSRGRGRGRGRGIPRGGRGGHRGSYGGRNYNNYTHAAPSTSGYSSRPQSQTPKNAQAGANFRKKEKN